MGMAAEAEAESAIDLAWLDELEKAEAKAAGQRKKPALSKSQIKRMKKKQKQQKAKAAIGQSESQSAPSAAAVPAKAASSSPGPSVPSSTPLALPTPRPPSSLDCSICCDPIGSESNIELACFSTHIYHLACLFDWKNAQEKRGEQHTCPQCRQPVKLEEAIFTE